MQRAGQLLQMQKAKQLLSLTEQGKGCVAAAAAAAAAATVTALAQSGLRLLNGTAALRPVIRRTFHAPLRSEARRRFASGAG